MQIKKIGTYRRLKRASVDGNEFLACYLYLVLSLLLPYQNAQTASSPNISAKPPWTKRVAMRLKQVWREGNSELYGSGYAWHNRYVYPHHKIATYNELALGGGFGKGMYDEDGDWHSLSAIAFLDSHKNIQPAAGYLFLKMAPVGNNGRFGAGYSILVTARPDLFHNIPFPGVLPWVAATYRQASLMVTYIPGSMHAGNVVFVLGRWTFDKIG